MSSEESNKMSKKTHSQDSNSEFERVWMEMEKIEPLTPTPPADPRNEEDYDTWEYGTEPLPEDHTWGTKKLATFDHLAFGDYDGYEDSLKAYQEAAKSDAFLFGDYNAYEAYKE